MKTRTLLSALTALSAFAGMALSMAPARADYDDFERCGTPYPGWWRRLLGPKKVTDLISIVDTQINSLPAVQNAYNVSITLQNKSLTQSTPDRMPIAMSFGFCDGSVFPNPDDPFDPNNPGNPYAFAQYGLANRGILHALKPGEKFTFSTVVYAQGSKGMKALSLSTGYDDWDWCGTPPRPWPGPNPWWFKLLTPDKLRDSLRMDLSQIVSLQDGPFRGYQTATVVISIKNIGRTTLAAGRAFRVVQGVGSQSGYPNPEDPIDPNGPWGPVASHFRFTPLQGKLGAIAPGASASLKMRVIYPTNLGYANQLSVQVQ